MIELESVLQTEADIRILIADVAFESTLGRHTVAVEDQLAVGSLFPFGSVHGICPVTELQIAVFLLTSVDFSQLADVGTPVGGQVPGKFLALDRSCCDN